MLKIGWKLFLGIGLAEIASAAAGTAADSGWVQKLARKYDYAGIRGANLTTSEGTARFAAGKALRLDFSSGYDLFPEDTAKYSIRDAFFTRQVFKGSRIDTGKVAGVLDLKSLLLVPGNCEVTEDSSHPDRKNLIIRNFLPAWFLLGSMPAAPIKSVYAQGWFDPKSLEIRQLEVSVDSPGGKPEIEAFLIDFDRYTTIQGRLIPGRIRYTMPGLSAALTDSSRAYLAKTSPKNADRRKHIRDLYDAEVKKGNSAEAEKIKRAATRIETLKRRIAESMADGPGAYEVSYESKAKGKKAP